MLTQSQVLAAVAYQGPQLELLQTGPQRGFNGLRRTRRPPEHLLLVLGAVPLCDARKTVPAYGLDDVGLMSKAGWPAVNDDDSLPVHHDDS